MTLISCPKCMGKLSSAAVACPRCGQAGPFEEPARSWTETPAYVPPAYAPAGSFEDPAAAATAVAPAAVVHAVPLEEERECPVCRLRSKRRIVCPYCEKRLAPVMYLLPHAFPRVPVNYAGFGARFVATFVDGLVMLPVVVPVIGSESHSPATTGLRALLAVIVYHGYNIVLTATWGQTLGKRLMKIQVRRADGRPVGWGTAFIRRLPNVLLDALGALVLALAAASLAGYDSPDAVQWRMAMRYATLPPLLESARGALTLFRLADVVVFFTNRRRRALHDLIAETVVINV